MTDEDIAKEVYRQIIAAVEQVRLDHRLIGSDIIFSVPDYIYVNGRMFWYGNIKDAL